MRFTLWRRAVAKGLVGVAAACVAAAGGAAHAAGVGPVQEDGADGVTLSVEAGIGGYAVPGRAFPVTVTVTTDRLIDGVLRLEVPGVAGSGVTFVERSVEVTGGSTARFTLLAPPATGDPGGNVRVRLSGSGASTEAVGEVQVDVGQELVGVLPEAAGPAGSLPGTVPLVVDAGVARLVPIDPELLAAGPLALEPLDQMVASAGELAALDTTTQQTLVTWVNGGGQLVLRDDPAAAEALPAEWRPPPGGAQRAGLGQVRAPGDDWQRSLAPSPTRSTFEEEIIASDVGGFVSQPMVATLGDDAGIRLPEGRRLGLLLGVYVLVMGPVAYVVVRRLRRRELAWAGLPVLAVASTGFVFATGSSLRNAAEAAQVTVYEVGPGGAIATTWSLVPSSRGGDVGVELPAGWTGRPAFDELGDVGVAFDPMGNPIDPSGGGNVGLTTNGDESRLVQDVGPGGFALLEAQGPATGLAGALEVTATSATDGEIAGTVRNRLDVTFESVAAFTGRARAVEIGTLGPGEAKDFRLEHATRFEWGAVPEADVWPADGMPFGGGGRVILQGQGGGVGDVVVDDNTAILRAEGLTESDDGDDEDGDDRQPPVVLSAWGQTLRRTGSNYRPSGQVVVAGWTDELEAPATPTGGQAERATAAVVARATPVPAASRLTDTASVKSIVRGPVTQPPIATPEAVGTNPIGFIQSFDLPDRVGDRPIDLERLVVNPARLFLTFDFWTPQGWVPIDAADLGQGEHPVPPAAVVGGAVYVRITAPTNAVPPSGRDLVIYEREGP